MTNSEAADRKSMQNTRAPLHSAGVEPIAKHFAAGLVVFRTDETGARLYLIIRHAAGHWELPKGHIEPGETWRQTARREVREETGISDLALIPEFARKIQYVYRGKNHRVIHKTVYFGLASTSSKTVRLSDEHSDFAFLAFHSAMARLTHAATRALLRDAERCICDLNQKCNKTQ
jgi:bis(5'-nucleosidyl)-tetraphosphatase